MGNARDVLQSHYLKYWTKTPASEVGYRVAELLDEWHGLNHFDSDAMRKVEWSNPLYIEVKLPHHHSAGQLSTFDFNGLTALVFLAHDHCIRVDVRPCDRSHFKLMFHPRDGRDGGMSRRHPTIETALAEWRRSHNSKEEIAAPDGSQGKLFGPTKAGAL